MTCKHCGEAILMTEPQGFIGDDFLHAECMFRMLAGSAAHILGECRCCGGTREDPPGMTARQAAQLALDTWSIVHGREVGR